MAAPPSTSRTTGVQLWDDPAAKLENAPPEKSPKKLAVFVDGYIPSFAYKGDHNPGAVFRCQDHVTSWGIAWKESRQGDSAVILPVLLNGTMGHPESGLSVVELQGLDSKTALLVVKEKAILSGECIVYGLILDYAKMSLDLCETVTGKGCLMMKERTTPPWWSPADMKVQWQVLEEELAVFHESCQPLEATPPKPASTRKAKSKRKAAVGAAGDAGEKQTPTKKAKDAQSLSLHRCVNMQEAEVRKLSKEDMKKMKELYNTAFSGLYRWGKKAICGSDGQPIRIHFEYLHKAPCGRLVYRGIDSNRLEGITNQARIAPDFHSDTRIITVLPLKADPRGPRSGAKYFDTEPPKEIFQDKKTHYFIIGGQHTVEAHKNLVKDGEIAEEDKALASTFSIVPVWAEADDNGSDIIMTLSRALNQNIAGEQKEQNFTKQLLSARTKWRSMGSPAPSIMGRPHSVEYNLFQPALVTIFAGMKPADSSELKIPLLFQENDADVDKWLRIEENYVKGLLPDAHGTVDPEGKMNRRPLTANDFKTLYGLRTEDLNYLASQVEAQSICMKKSTAISLTSGRQLVSLEDAGRKERLVRAMKNELLRHYKNYLLPMRKMEYVPYPESAWEEFAAERKITRKEVELWVNVAMEEPAGSKWLKNRTRPLNKTTDPKDCPQFVTDMWKAFFNATGEAGAMGELEEEFSEHYLCRIMDERRWNIDETLADPDVEAWWGANRPHLYFWFMFEGTPTGPRAKVLEDGKLERLFDALEFHDSRDNTVSVRSGAILFMDNKGFYTVGAHLGKRREKTKCKVWDCHVVNYTAGSADGFPSPASGKRFNVFIVFMFGTSSDRSTRACFKSFFPGLEDLQPVYNAQDMSSEYSYWKRPGVPYLKVNTPMTIFKGLDCHDHVLVNVNGGPEITHLGLHWKGVKVLEVVESKEAAAESKEFAEQIWGTLRARPKFQLEEVDNSSASPEKPEDAAPLEESPSELSGPRQRTRSPEKEKEACTEEQPWPSTRQEDVMRGESTEREEEANEVMEVDPLEVFEPSALDSPTAGIEREDLLEVAEQSRPPEDQLGAAQPAPAQEDAALGAQLLQDLGDVAEGAMQMQVEEDGAQGAPLVQVQEDAALRAQLLQDLGDAAEGAVQTQAEEDGAQGASLVQVQEDALLRAQLLQDLGDAAEAPMQTQVEEDGAQGAPLVQVQEDAPLGAQLLQDLGDAAEAPMQTQVEEDDGAQGAQLLQGLGDGAQGAELVHVQEDVALGAQLLQGLGDVVEGAMQTQVEEDVAQGAQLQQQFLHPSAPDALVVILSDSSGAEEEESAPLLEGSTVETSIRMDAHSAAGNEAAVGSGRVEVGKRRRESDAAAGAQHKGGNSDTFNNTKKKSRTLAEVLRAGASSAAEKVVHTERETRSRGERKEFACGSSGGGASEETKEPLVYTRKGSRKAGRAQGVDAWLLEGRDGQPRKRAKTRGGGDTGRAASQDLPRSWKSLVVIGKDVPKRGRREDQDVRATGVEASGDLPVLQKSIVPPDQEVGAPSPVGTDEQSNAAPIDPLMKPVQEEGLLMGVTVDDQEDTLVELAPPSGGKHNGAVCRLDITSVAATLVDCAMVALGEGEGDKSEVLDALPYEGEVITRLGFVSQMRDICALTRDDLWMGRVRPLYESKFCARKFRSEQELNAAIREHRKRSEFTEANRQAIYYLYKSVYDLSQFGQEMQPRAGDDIGRGVTGGRVARGSTGQGSRDGVLLGAVGDTHIRSHGSGGGVASAATAGHDLASDCMLRLSPAYSRTASSHARPSSLNTATRSGGQQAAVGGTARASDSPVATHHPRQNSRTPAFHPRYYVVLDLNGVLIHRSFDDPNRPNIKARPHVGNFLDRLYESVNLVFWSSMVRKNVFSALDYLLRGLTFKAKDVTVLSQEHCTRSSYTDPRHPEKPFFLKNLATVAKILKLDSVDYVVLVDDSPLKNLANDVHSAVFPPTWGGDYKDMVLPGVLLPWLRGLYKSNDPVPKYVESNPLFHGQRPADPLGHPGNLILTGTLTQPRLQQAS